MSDENNNPLKSTENVSTLLKLWDEWKIFALGIFRPLVIIPLGLTILALWFANIPNLDKGVSLILQIVATLLAAIASGFFYDVIRSSTEKTILIKKGLSAVRNLSLARLKTKNISDRTNGNVSMEEIRNLLSWLEKDIANATQEWNDILPGVGRIEEVYALLADKESELELTKEEKELLNTQLIEEKQLGEKEKENLKKHLNEKEKRISELSHEINKLRSTASSSPLIRGGLLGGLTMELQGSSIVSETVLLGLGKIPEKLCSKCGKTYRSSSLLDVGLCENCRSNPYKP